MNDRKQIHLVVNRLAVRHLAGMKTLRNLVIAAAFLVPAAAKDPRPNIIVLLADDLGWHDLACTGHGQHRTPNLDRLAAAGMQFTDANAAAPICSASRAALLTGRSPARLKYEFVPKFETGRQKGPWPLVTPDYPTELPSDTPTVGNALKAAGYATAFAGKWHLNRHQGRYLGWRPGHGPESFGFDHCIDDLGAHPYSYGGKTPPPVDGDSFPADRLTDGAVGFLRRDHDRPFLLWMSYYQVHDPFHSRCADRIAWHQARLPVGADPKRARYAAMVETLDHEVGRLLDAIDATGKAKDTLVIFTSDNGGHPEVSANGPLRGSKWNLYQGGLRVPWLVRWPAVVKAGSRCADPVIGSDLAATLLAAAGIDPAQATDGRSFLPQLEGRAPESTSLDRELVWHFPFYQPETGFEKAKRDIGVNDFAVSQTRPQSALRQGRWKLVHHYEGSRDELFDLAADPSEQKDLSRQEPQRAAAMRERLFSQLSDAGARMPRPRP
ncbi:sulfatase [Luteolibacter arcticus]|uniref:Sulfatase n=1 Tax=Luteolibacter arcticus TaxID=1581411 RepID=A0ABT3GIS9_9BACT|nr:sulfatase [Luteolibacter arcticus]MCW1923402.1 sulfatase [Luteolibacter arcticus]